MQSAVRAGVKSQGKTGAFRCITLSQQMYAFTDAAAWWQYEPGLPIMAAGTGVSYATFHTYSAAFADNE